MGITDIVGYANYMIRNRQYLSITSVLLLRLESLYYILMLWRIRIKIYLIRKKINFFGLFMYISFQESILASIFSRNFCLKVCFCGIQSRRLLKYDVKEIFNNNTTTSTFILYQDYFSYPGFVVLFLFSIYSGELSFQ